MRQYTVGAVMTAVPRVGDVNLGASIALTRALRIVPVKT